MRTTIRLDDELLRQAKENAVRTGRTLTKVIEDALRSALSQRETAAPTRVRLPVVRGRVRPGVDLDDNAALRDLMDVDAAP